MHEHYYLEKLEFHFTSAPTSKFQPKIHAVVSALLVHVSALIHFVSALSPVLGNESHWWGHQ